MPDDLIFTGGRDLNSIFLLLSSFAPMNRNYPKLGENLGYITKEEFE